MTTMPSSTTIISSTATPPPPPPARTLARQRTESTDTLDGSRRGSNLSACRFYLLGPMFLWSMGAVRGMPLFFGVCCLEYGLKPILTAHKNKWAMSRDGLLSAGLGTTASALFLLAGGMLFRDNGHAAIVVRSVVPVPSPPLLIITLAVLLQSLAMSSLRLRNKTRILIFLVPLGTIALLLSALA